MAQKTVPQSSLPMISNDQANTSITHQERYVHQATSNNTRRAYQAAIAQFERHGGQLPATEQIIADYLTQQATQLNPRTLSLHLTALSHWHQYQAFVDPTQTAGIRKLLKGIHRTHGQPKQRSKALTLSHIQQMVAYCEQQNNLKYWRNSALIQVAYFGAFRRSELVAIDMEHLQFEHQGLLIVVPRSKTDQTGEGKVKALPYGQANLCPVRALKKWLSAAAITQGPVFRGITRWDQLQAKALHSESINTMLKSIGKHCQFDFIDTLSSHSLRRGFATSAASVGAEFSTIKKQGGWKNDATVRSYIEEGQLFDKNAADRLLKSLHKS